MDRVAVAGLSLHHTDVEGLERVKRALARLDEPPAKALADHLGASEAVLLSTCNRLELVYARENGHAPAQADLAALAALVGTDDARVLFLHTGRAAARHLFRVTASLDSLVLGEDGILAQVRAAFAEARELGLTGRILGPLFDQAVHLGKRVRTATDLARRPVSVVSLGVAFLLERLGDLPDARIAVIGAGATGAHAARALAAAGRAPAFVANRTAARAETVAREVGARTLSLDDLRGDDLRGAREPLDAVVSATSAPEPVLTAADVARLAARTRPGRRLVTVDLAVPRDIEPSPLADAIDIEALRERAEANRQLRAAAAVEAELLVEEELAGLFRERDAERLARPYSDLVREARELFELELDRLADGRGCSRLARLDPLDREAVARWARLAFGRLAHVPFRALKHLARTEALPGGEWEGLE